MIGALLLCATRPDGAVQEARRVPRRDPGAQGLIRALAEAASEEEQRRALQDLERGLERQDLIQQLFLFSSGAGDTREAMVFGFVRSELCLAPQDIIVALLPFLESEELELREETGNVLSEFEHRSVDRGADLSVYRTILEAQLAQGQELAPGLVRHLYRTDAGAALLLMARIHLKDPEELKPILWAEHAIADVLWKQRLGFLGPDEIEPAAVEQLRILARHPHWWARLHAASVLSAHRAFRAAVPLEPLREDLHPLVREVASSVAPSERPR